MERKKTFIGIDFSLNSPSITIHQSNDTFTFISLFNNDGKLWKEKDLKTYTNHKNLYDNNIIVIKDYERIINSKDYSIKEQEKMMDAIKLANLVIDTIKENILDKDSDILISIEGFSYNSQGMSYIDLIMYNSFLRKILVETFGKDSIMVIAPKSAKKFAGKGNADKNYMIQSFQNNVLKNNIIVENELYKYVNSEKFDKDHIKPIDDLIDSYFICECAKGVFEKNFKKS